MTRAESSVELEDTDDERDATAKGVGNEDDRHSSLFGIGDHSCPGEDLHACDDHGKERRTRCR